MITDKDEDFMRTGVGVTPPGAIATLPRLVKTGGTEHRAVLRRDRAGDS